MSGQANGINKRTVAQVSAGGDVRFGNRATGLYLDGLGDAASGSALGQWSGSTSTNQQWTAVAVS
jgi:hypothetical protein